MAPALHWKPRSFWSSSET